MKNAQMSKACSKKLVFSQLAEQTRGETKKGVQPRAHEIKKQLSPTRSSHREGRRMSREVPQIPICTRAHRHRAQPHKSPTEPQLREHQQGKASPPSSGNLGPRRRRVVNHAQLRAPSGPPVGTGSRIRRRDNEEGAGSAAVGEALARGGANPRGGRPPWLDRGVEWSVCFFFLSPFFFKLMGRLE
jgi:hypothetical protein